MSDVQDIHNIFSETRQKLIHAARQFHSTCVADRDASWAATLVQVKSAVAAIAKAVTTSRALRENPHYGLEVMSFLEEVVTAHIKCTSTKAGPHLLDRWEQVLQCIKTAQGWDDEDGTHETRGEWEAAAVPVEAIVDGVRNTIDLDNKAYGIVAGKAKHEQENEREMP